ncbi:MAG: RNA methyltransferase [Candidatus Paceibacterota bacterium]|jgi:tRNA G18 (ribose-2'-O)-methylase SpoU
MKPQKVVILDNVRSIHNVGSIFRTSDALGINKIYLCGYTPTPKDRFGRERQDLAKVALGAEKDIEWEYVKETKDIIKALKKEKYQIIAVEQAKNSVDYKEVRTKAPVALVMGNEVGGIEKDILKLADVIAEIPMNGNKESLNVSVSFGIAGYEIFGK